MAGMSRPKSKVNGKNNDKAKRRTPRACDRCRLKKSKCDGAARCKTCQATDSKCLYTARRGREARTYYCQMREVTDEALQRLYWACRSNSGFPGEIPDESQGPPSTAAILNALGLIRPSFEDGGASQSVGRPMQAFPLDASHHIHHSRNERQMITPPAEDPSRRDGYLPSHTQSSLSMSPLSHSPKSRPPLTITAPLRQATPPEMDMSEQFIHVASVSAPSSRSSSINKREYQHPDTSSDAVFDMDTYLDISACSLSSSPYSRHKNHGSTQFDTQAMTGSTPQSYHVSVASSQPGTLCDSFLSPWPGSIAAAYAH